MASLVKELVEAGIHFGHRSTHWNPKMSPYIYGRRNRIHVIDVRETVRGLLLARKFLTQTVASGKDVLFVGTKRQARGCIEEFASEAGMHWVTERWLGGTLTNFRTIRERLKRLEELEQLEESGDINNYSKKMESTLRREKTKIKRNLDGIRNMTKLPGVVVVIDVKHESNAVNEARKLGIPTVSLIDTDSDPDLADIPIPGNDDAMKAIEIVVKSLCAAVMEGKQQQRTYGKAAGAEAEADGAPRSRRSARAMFRADEQSEGGAAEPNTDAEAAPAEPVTATEEPPAAPAPEAAAPPAAEGEAAAETDRPA